MIEERDKLIEELIKAEAYERECWQKAFLSENDRIIHQESYNNIFELQRQIAALESTEYCEPFDFPYQWDTGSPLPHLFQNDNKTFLIYYLKEQKDKIHDGKTIEIINPEKSVYPIAIVEFRSWHASLGAPNDEGLQGHHLWGKGLDYYTPLIVKNSEQIKKINKIYPFSTKMNFVHYIFPFHDCTFECVAESYKVEIVSTTMQEAITSVINRL